MSAATHPRRLFQIVRTLALVAVLLALPMRAVHSDVETPPRQKLITVEYTIYEWWLASWADNEVVCQIFLEREGPPSPQEVYWFCGTDVSEQWGETKTCPQAIKRGGDASSCEGLYLSLVKQTPAKKEIWITLPSPTIWVSLSQCTPIAPENRCEVLPTLHLRAIEPLPNEMITAINGTINDTPFECESAICELPLSPTGTTGIYAYFQAESSMGDRSELFSARIRVVEAPATESQPPGWYVDVLSTQWRGGPLASCSQVWETFPPPGGPPEWLTTPEDALSLATDEPYVYLAGVLISYGEVDAVDCPDHGLLPSGGANACGLERALEEATVWQNRFDEIILSVARDTGVPAQLVKNLFARESQFWPGIFSSVEEAGLGQLTENGADTTLLWNESFYSEFCPLVLEQTACDQGYVYLEEEEQAMLRGALFNRVNAQCDECTMGIDMNRANISVEVFAETLLANCAQVGQMIWNTTGDLPRTSTFEDLWRFTVLNYNAGPGCLADAIKKTYKDGLPLSWENVAGSLSEVCTAGIDYVNDIAR